MLGRQKVYFRALSPYFCLREIIKMAVPKRKVSKSRRDKRRSSVWKLKSPTLVRCSHCTAYKVLHRVCKVCGYYREKQVEVIKTPAATKA